MSFSLTRKLFFPVTFPQSLNRKLEEISYNFCLNSSSLFVCKETSIMKKFSFVSIRQFIIILLFLPGTFLEALLSGRWTAGRGNQHQRRTAFDYIFAIDLKRKTSMKSVVTEKYY